MHPKYPLSKTLYSEAPVGGKARMRGATAQNVRTAMETEEGGRKSEFCGERQASGRHHTHPTAVAAAATSYNWRGRTSPQVPLQNAANSLAGVTGRERGGRETKFGNKCEKPFADRAHFLSIMGGGGCLF